MECMASAAEQTHGKLKLSYHAQFQQPWYDDDCKAVRQLHALPQRGPVYWLICEEY